MIDGLDMVAVGGVGKHIILLYYL